MKSNSQYLIISHVNSALQIQFVVKFHQKQKSNLDPTSRTFTHLQSTANVHDWSGVLCGVVQGPESGHCGGNRPAFEGAASRLGRRRRAALEGSRPALEEAESKLGGAGKLGGEQAEEQAWRPWRARVQQARRGGRQPWRARVQQPWRARVQQPGRGRADFSVCCNRGKMDISAFAAT